MIESGKIRRMLPLLLWLVCTMLRAEGRMQDIMFKHLAMREKLSHYSVMALYQDERGLIWIGTRNGVNVFDGREVHVCRHEADDPHTLLGNFVRDITGDGEGNVYFLTLRGISCYNTTTESFSTLSHLSASAICYDHRLYMAVNQRVYLRQDGQFRPCMELPDPECRISSLYASRDTLLIGTKEHGLFIYHQDTRQLDHILPTGTVSNIFKESRGCYWIGTWNDGLFCLDRGKLTNYRADDRKPTSLASNFIRCCREDQQGNLWIGTFRGLSLLRRDSGTFENYLSDENGNPETTGSVWSLLCDAQGTMWVGTYFGGVNYFNPGLDFYHRYPVTSQPGKGLNFPVVGEMTEDDEGHLWICTDGGGLNMLDRRTGQFTHYVHSDDPHSISHNNVRSLYYDRARGVLWVGTHLGGLNKMDLRTRRFTRYPYTHEGKKKELANIVCDIVPHGDELLLATHDGVYSFHPETALFTPLFKEGREGAVISLALDLQLDGDSLLWIGGVEEGAYAYHFRQKRLIPYTHYAKQGEGLSSNGVNCIYRDGDNLWFCMAETGLDLYRHDTHRFEHFDERKNGLQYNCVYGACRISPDQLLVITDKGFSCLEQKTGRFRNFDGQSGLPLSALNQNAIYMTHDGEIFLGGIDGMVSFRPENLNMQPAPYSIFPYRLYVNDQEVHVGDETGILKQALWRTPSLRLKAGQSMFSILYAVTDYMPLSQNNLMYKLEHFNNNWTAVRGGRIITYTNLNPGHYTLWVKTSEKNGPVSRLDIEVLPPFYATVWAYLVYGLVTIALVYFLVRTYKNRIRLQTELKYERKHVQDVEMLNQNKLRFFTNISHEFRTPLTLIIGQMEMLLQVRNFAPSVYNKILSVYRNGQQLQELITELLDFRKQEQGHMRIKVCEHNLVDFLYENYLLFREYALRRHINFKFNKSNDHIAVWYDAKQMQKVVNNLLSNAFKYTPEQGEITLSVRRGHKEVIVEVADSGCGIAPDEMEHLFNRFYQTDHALTSPGQGIGVGLALSKGIVELHHGRIEVFSTPGEGSTFTLHLPLGCEAFAEDEIYTEETNYDYIHPAQTYDFEAMDESATLHDHEEEPNRSILIVEDDEKLRRMMNDIFSPYYRVTAVASGEEAMQQLEQALPDLVLCDVLMPGMSGIDLCKKMKDNVRTCHIPVMLLTAHTAIEYKLKGLQTGADDYITKPFDVNILLARCKNLINNRLMLQEKYSHQPQQATPLFATTPDDKAFCDRAMHIIDQHLSESEFNADQFAREMGVARTKLFAKLKAITGKTPNDLLLQARLKKAAYMLKNNPELNIAEISDRVGFCSSRYFSRCFKEMYHLTPQAYRKGEEIPENNS